MGSNQEYESITVTGPTASGKTKKAVALAMAFNGEIISADSRQVYVGMDLGTGKDLEEYGNIPYHLIDIAPAGSKYNLFQYLKDFKIAYDEIRNRNTFPVICGGSGMYLENAIAGINLPDVPANEKLRKELEGKSLEELTEILSKIKVLHNTTDVDTCKRAIRAIEIQEYYRTNPRLNLGTQRSSANKLNTLIVGIDISREDRRRRISERLEKRVQNGMLDEVRKLLDSGIKAEDLIYYGLEYKYLTQHLTGELTYSQMLRELEIAIHQFAKRQMTWFRGMERRGFKINWLPYNISDEEFVCRVKDLLGA